VTRLAAVAATTSLLALLAGAAPAQAAPARTADSCAATLAAEALLTTTAAPTSSAHLVGRSTAATSVRVDARGTDPSGARVLHLAPGTVLEVEVAQGQQQVVRTELLSGAWVQATDVTGGRSFLRCTNRLR
jgi:hypothetical protein